MLARALILFGALALALVIAVAVWPASPPCPALPMTAAQLEAAQDLTLEQANAAYDSAMARSSCLLAQMNKETSLGAPPPLDAFVAFVRTPVRQQATLELMDEATAAIDASTAASSRIDAFAAQGSEP